MQTSYSNKMMLPIDKGEKEEGTVRIMMERDGKRYVTRAKVGQRVKFRDGTEYEVDEHGSLRRVKR